MSYNARDRRRIRPAPAPGYAGPTHDAAYEDLFSHLRMVEDLLCGFADQAPYSVQKRT